MILEGRIIDVKLSSFSCDFQTLSLISYVFSLWIINYFDKRKVCYKNLIEKNYLLRYIGNLTQFTQNYWNATLR